MGKILESPFRVEFSRRPVKAIGKDKMFELTNVGKREVEQLEPDDAEFPIMSELHHKSMSLDDLSKATGTGPKQAEFMVKKLIRGGKVKPVES